MENVTYISKTFLIFSYFPSTFPVIAFDSCHCAKQNAKQNAATQSVPLGAGAPIVTPLLRYWLKLVQNKPRIIEELTVNTGCSRLI